MSGPTFDQTKYINKNQIGIGDACAKVTAALTARAAQVGGCPLTIKACPSYLGDSATCPENDTWDEGVVTGCVSFIGSLNTCDDLSKHPCLLLEYHTTPCGMSAAGGAAGASGSGGAAAGTGGSTAGAAGAAGATAGNGGAAAGGAAGASAGGASAGAAGASAGQGGASAGAAGNGGAGGLPRLVRCVRDLHRKNARRRRALSGCRRRFRW